MSGAAIWSLSASIFDVKNKPTHSLAAFYVEAPDYSASVVRSFQSLITPVEAVSDTAGKTATFGERVPDVFVDQIQQQRRMHSRTAAEFHFQQDLNVGSSSLSHSHKPVAAVCCAKD